MCTLSNSSVSSVAPGACAVVFSAALLVSGCGGGSDPAGSANGGGVVPQNNTPFPAVNLNGSLQGRVYVAGNSTYLDLSSGEVVELAGEHAFARRDGTELAEIHDDYRFLDGAACNGEATHLDRIVLRDVRSGIASSAFELADGVRGPVKLSPDGQTLALFWRQDYRCSNQGTRLSVLSRQGKEIVRGVDGISSFDWTPDNRLAFTYEQKVALEAERNTFRFETLADMSSVDGWPGHIAVSPDGSRVLFEMITDGTNFLSTGFYRNATVWSVSTRGGDLRKHATTSRYVDPNSSVDGPRINTPVWSPDGRSILLTENYTNSSVILTDDASVVIDVMPVANQGLTYAVPAATAPVELPPERYSASAVRPLISTDLDGVRKAMPLDPSASLIWTPVTTRAPTIAGSLPFDNGRLNRGLAGEVVFIEEGSGGYPVMKSLELSSGLVSDIKQFRDENMNIFSTFTGLSADGKYSAHHVSDGVDRQYLRIYDAVSERVASLKVIGDNYYYKPASALRFSPVNSNLIAWIFDNGNFGTGALVLDWTTRQFVVRWSSRNFTELAWTREGDLLLFDLGKAYRSKVSNGQFSELQLLFDIPDAIEHPALNPVTNDIAFSSGGQLFSIGLDGQRLRRLVEFSQPSVDFPAWSPDGRYLSVVRGTDGFIVAANAENVRLYDAGRSVGAVEISKANEGRTAPFYGPLYWR